VIEGKAARRNTQCLGDRRPLRRRQNGVDMASAILIQSDTIVGAFRQTVRNFPDELALHYRGASEWEAFTWAEYERRVEQVSAR
jgi:hypothetical protein